jgi:hypothetical protein
VSNPLKLAAYHWASAQIRGVRFQIPWDENRPQYGKYHFAFAKGTLSRILSYTEENCPYTEADAIRSWMKGNNPWEMHVGIDCNGFVYRVLDEAARMTGAPGLVETMGTTCEYTPIEDLMANEVILRAQDMRAGNTIKFNKGFHSGVIIETVTDEDGVVKEIWYAHSSFTRGPHVGYVLIGDPNANLNSPKQNWVDDMWDFLTNNGLRERYFTSVHQSPFYRGLRPRVSRIGGIRIVLNGNRLAFDTPPFILGGRTMCQVRPVVEAAGGDVDWEPLSETITFSLNGNRATCQVGSELATIRGRQYLLDEPPMLYAGHSLVPLRFIATVLDLGVEWDGASKTVYLRQF